MGSSKKHRARWAFYWRALGGDFTGWDAEDAPFPGFWRVRYSKTSLWLPCAIWDTEAGACLAVVDFDERPQRALTLWGMGCWQNPVSDVAYNHAIAHKVWADTLVASQIERNAGQPVVDVSKAEPIVPRRKA